MPMMTVQLLTKKLAPLPIVAMYSEIFIYLSLCLNLLQPPVGGIFV